jgi:hypothetical protein
MSPQPHAKNGRLFVCLRRGKVLRPKYLHRLVLESFIGPCPDGLEALHRDGNYLHNHLSNLRWGTHLENIHDKFVHGTMLFGQKNPAAKVTEPEVVQIRELCASGMMLTQIAEMFNVSDSLVQVIVHGDIWKDAAGPIIPWGKRGRRRSTCTT